MSFEFNIRCEQRFTGIRKIHLSLSQYEPPPKKELAAPGGHTKASRKTPKEHLDELVRKGRITDFDRPLMLLSTRNVLANLRCIAYLEGYTQKPLAVSEENDIVLKSRPYYILGRKNGMSVLDKWDPDTWNSEKEFPFSWFISGVPVIWDDADEKSLFQMIVCEAADHSHVWKLPRGSHPVATERTRNIWKSLQEIFISTLTLPECEVFSALNACAVDNSLEREHDYLHNILGVDKEGNLCQLIAKGKLEDLGTQMKNMWGVKRALCVDNSGSVTVQFFGKGIGKSIDRDYCELAAAPNHRLPGTAYIAIELQDALFGI